MPEKSDHLIEVRKELSETYQQELNLPVLTLLRVNELLDEAVEAGLTRSRCYKTVIAAITFLAAREQNIPRVAEDFANATIKDGDPLEPRKVRQESRKIKRELGVKIKPIPADTYLDYYADELAVTEETRETAHELLRLADEHGISKRPAPTSLAAGAIDAARRLTDDNIIQSDIAEVTHVSIAQFREYCQDLQEIPA